MHIDYFLIWKVIMMDSQNKPCLDADAPALRAMSEAMPFKTWVETGWPHKVRVKVRVRASTGLVERLEGRNLDSLIDYFLKWKVMVDLQIDSFQGTVHTMRLTSNEHLTAYGSLTDQ